LKRLVRQDRSKLESLRYISCQPVAEEVIRFAAQGKLKNCLPVTGILAAALVFNQDVTENCAHHYSRQRRLPRLSRQMNLTLRALAQ
jgi:hypothetical protein